MGFITIIVVLLVAALLAEKWQEDFYDTFPMTVSGLILLLYVLAFSQNLQKIDLISACVLGSVAVYGFIVSKDKKRFGRQLAERLFSVKAIVMLCFFVLITILVKDKAALWWDDINFWAVDAKALYFNGGFAGKYGNVAPEFGDYPPALQLFKWVFLHLFSSFREGMMFAAYHCLNVIYALPLLVGLKKKNPLYAVMGILAVFLFPGIIDGMAAEGTCADVTMGIVYGAFLWAVYDRDHKDTFYFLRMTLYLCVLVLTKSVGIEWAFFGVIFFFLVYTKHLADNGIAVKEKIKWILYMCGACLCTEGSWLLFCLINRRVAKLTGAGVKIALSGDLSFLENVSAKAGHFLRGFAFHPMHYLKTWGIDLSSLGFLVFVLLVVVWFKKTKILQKWEANRLLGFVLLTAFAAYGIIFLGHITIFAGEMQYLDDAVMSKSIARYGAPFSAGLLYLLLGIFTKKKEAIAVGSQMKKMFRVSAYGICLLFILLTTSLPGTYQMLFGYRATLEADVAGRDAMVEAEADIFLDKAFLLKAGEDKENPLFDQRVLYLRDDNTIHWVKDTYISYEASPIPVVYGGIATDTMIEEDMIRKIKESHAKYLYADAVAGDPTPLFESMADGEFAYETFYEIIEEDGILRLVEIQ